MFITLTCIIIGVADGDTVTCLDNQRTQHKIRLAEIDAPEKKQEFGFQSKQSLSDLIFNKIVTINYEKKDRYNRIVGYIKKGTTDINQAQIKKGLAWFYEDYGQSDIYRQTQNLAKRNKIGLWSGQNIIAPWDFRKGIKTSKEPVKSNLITQIKQKFDNMITGTIKNTYDCDYKFCKNIASCDEAMYLLNVCGFKKLDKDNDGKPCENVCH